MKAPSFWNTRNLISTCLLPASLIYLLGRKIHCACVKPKKLPIPVICVGNLTVGGAGKTPVALHIGNILKKKNINAFFVSRGYGGKERGPVRVDIEQHDAKQVGDEPLLLAQTLPTIVGRNRVQAAQLAIEQGAQAIIMDDGFQNPCLVQDLSLIVVDRRLSFGNERTLPAGPLREKVASGLKRANAIVIINPANFMPTSLPNIPFLLARSQPQPSMLALKGKKIIAFCGIAVPTKFYYMLKNVGAEISEKISFPDHYYYTRKDLEELHKKALEQNANLVTTSKDAARLAKDFKKEIDGIIVAEMRLAFDNENKLEELIETVLDAKKS
jgi:tetraacyldisaccharide 4'-kinase